MPGTHPIPRPLNATPPEPPNAPAPAQPPTDGDATALHQSFVLAGKEPGVTAPAVRPPHPHPGGSSGRRSVHLYRRGRAYLKEVQRILAEVHGVSEQQRATPRRVRIVSVEAVAEKWLVPRLASFRAAWPGAPLSLSAPVRPALPGARTRGCRHRRRAPPEPDRALTSPTPRVSAPLLKRRGRAALGERVLVEQPPARRLAGIARLPPDCRDRKRSTKP